MTDFVQDGTSLPTGKTDARPLTGSAAEHITAAEWESVMQALYDLRAKIQLSFGYINVKSFGAVGDGVADDYAAIQAAINSQSSTNRSGQVVYFPPGTYRSARPIHLHRACKLQGAIGFTTVSSGAAAPATILFDTNRHGIIVDRPTTSPDGGSGEGSIIEGLGVVAASKTAGTLRHGITLRAKASLRNVLVEGFSGDGIHVVAASDWNTVDSNTEWATSTAYVEGDVVKGVGDTKRYVCLQSGTSSSGGGGPTGTGSSITDGSCVWKYTSGCFANNWKIEDCRSVDNSGHGLYVEGDNVNAGSCTALDATLNGEWGIMDRSFLGNTYVACHAATNGWRTARNQVPTSVPNWATSTAYTVGQYVRANGKGYYCRTAGTSSGSGTGPSGTGSNITDGTAAWDFNTFIWQAGTAVVKHGYCVNDSGKTYKCITAGTTASSGGPTGTGSSITDGSAVWAYVAYPPGSYGTNITALGAYDGNANAPNAFYNCYGEQDQAPGAGFSPSFFDGGLHANYIYGGRGFRTGTSLGGTGASLRQSSTKFDLENVNAPTDPVRAINVGESLGGGRVFTISPPTGATASLCLNLDGLYHSKFLSWGVVSQPGYQAWGIGQHLAKIAQREVPIGQLAVNHLYGLFIGTSRITALSALPADSWISNGMFQNYYQGDLIFDTAPVAGGRLGWVCLTNGTTGTYVEGLTVTADGSATLVASGSSTVLAPGNYITITGKGSRRIDAVSGTSITVNSAVTAGSGLAISYTAPTFAEFGKVAGGAGDSTGTPGNATLNTQKGRSAIDAGAASVTITNSKVTSSSIVCAVLQTSDGTLTQILRVVPGSGSFVITGNANATSAVNVGWWIEE